MYFTASRAKALAGEHAVDLKHEEERRKKRGLIKPCTFLLQGSLWFVFRAPGNHGTDDSSGNQSSLESMDTPFKQRHCRLHSWDRESTITTNTSQLAKILFQVREMFHKKLIQPLNRNPAAFYITGILNCVYKHLFSKSETWIVPWGTLKVYSKLQTLSI